MLVPRQFDDIIRKHQRTAPVNVIALASEMGVSVWESDKLGPQISGKLFRDPKNGGTSGWSILVRATDPLVRKRFTVAHEVSHFVLHRSEIGDGITDDEFYRSSLSNAQEAQANQLAADILMPFRLLNDLTAEGVTEVDALASRLEVSLTALKIRLGIPVAA
jgi:hypothetical protein